MHVHSFVREMLDFRIKTVHGFAAGELTLYQVRHSTGTEFKFTSLSYKQADAMIKISGIHVTVEIIPRHRWADQA